MTGFLALHSGVAGGRHGQHRPGNAGQARRISSAAGTRTRDAVQEARPETLRGMVALARTAKVMARKPDGMEDFADGPARHVVANLVNDLLRVFGGTVPEAV